MQRRSVTRASSRKLEEEESVQVAARADATIEGEESSQESLHLQDINLSVAGSDIAAASDTKPCINDEPSDDEVDIDPITRQRLDESDENRTVMCGKIRYDTIAFATYLYMKGSECKFLDPILSSELEERFIMEIDSKVDALQQQQKQEVARASDPAALMVMRIPRFLPQFLKRNESEVVEKRDQMRRASESRASLTTMLDGLISEVYSAIEKEARAGVSSSSSSSNREEEEEGVVKEADTNANAINDDSDDLSFDFDLEISAIFSEFDTVFALLLRDDVDYAHGTVESYKTFLQGHPKRPTKDPHNRLPRIMSMLDSAMDEEHRSKLKARRRHYSADF
jgi:hypothetical protein